MSIKPEYFEYLDHFGATATLAELHAHPERRDVIALRHDIDYDLDLALETAHYEAERGIRATYYLLHSADYWNDPHFHSKCRQLEAYGHEVGLHANVLTEWIRGECDDVGLRVRELLDHLRESGVTVTSTSAHGDRQCYRSQFINYWIWQELCGSDPAAAQKGRCAEGPVVDDEKWQIEYPADHCLVREDGLRCPLWQVSLEAEGIEYDAAHLPFDHYWTDSGGRWTRSGDPLESDLSRGRHQVLLHPIWWRGLQRKFFVLSTARSGSTWLATFVDRATSCRGIHEWTLNHVERGGQMVHDKQTSCDFQNLLNDVEEVGRRVEQAGQHFTQIKGDVLEANVYLERAVDSISESIPDAEIIHLHRNGPDVVRSLINRDWYAQPEDTAHPPVDGVDWSALNQFERACWYYRLTNQRIVAAAARSWPLEKVCTDLDYLRDQLRELGIVVHPLLAEEVFSQRVNAGSNTRFPAWDVWPAECRESYLAVCGETGRLLGYPAPTNEPESGTDDLVTRPAAHVWTDIRGGLSRIRSRFRNLSAELISRIFRSSYGSKRATQPVQLLSIRFDDHSSPTPRLKKRSDWSKWQGVRLAAANVGLALMPTGDAFNNSYLLLSGGSWQKVTRRQGIRAREGTYFRGTFTANCPENSCARIFALIYDRSGKLLNKLHVANLRHERPVVKFAFSVLPATASHFSLALHMDSQVKGPLVVQSIELERLLLPENYSVWTEDCLSMPRLRSAA